VLQAAVINGVSFDPFPFPYDGFIAREVNIGRLLGTFCGNPHKVSAKMCFGRKFSKSQFGSFSTE
jgi:hypothetical protein